MPKDELETKVSPDKSVYLVTVVWLDQSVKLDDEVKLDLWDDLVLMADPDLWDPKDPLDLWDPQVLMV